MSHRRGIIGGVKTLVGSCAVLSALLLTSCASAEDVAQISSEDTSSAPDPTETIEPTASTEATAPTEPSQTIESTAPTDSTPTAVSTPATPTQTPTTQEAQLAGKPKVGDCYDITKRQFRQQRDGSFPVRCSRRHTGETFAVFNVSSAPTGSQTDKVWRTCHARFPAYVGDAATLSKLDLTLILPSNDQTSAGQKWIRCDVIQKASYNSRVGVPRTGSLKNTLRGGVPREFRGCVTRWPKVDQAVHFTPCGRRHQAELIPDSLFLGPPEATYPGVATAKTRSQQFCESVFQDYVPETNNYYYYYPTKASWKSGSHNTTCWALDTRGDGLPPS